MSALKAPWVRILGCVSVVLAVSMLTGCDRHAVSPIAVRLDGGELEFLFCEGIDATAVSVETRKLPADWVSVLESSAPVTIDAGQILTMRGLSPDFEPPVPVLVPREELVISVTGPDDAQVSAFSWPEMIPDGSWLTVDGVVADDPCGSTT